MKDAFKKQLLISGSIILGEFLIASIAFFFLANAIASLSGSIALHRAAILGEASTIEAVAELKQDVPSAVKYQAAMDRILTSQDELITFPTQVSNLGRTEGVSTNFSFSGTAVSAVGSTPGMINFSLDVTGPLNNVVAFVKDFESTAPILLSEIDTFNLAGDGASYTLSANGKVFFK